MALRDTIRGVMSRYHLHTGFFAETVQFMPAGGSPRNVVVHIEEDSDWRREEIYTATEDERITVLAFRDPDAVDPDGNPIGGIDTKQTGDKILRGTTADPAQRPYFFDREFRAQTPDKVRLQYSRSRRVEQGVGR